MPEKIGILRRLDELHAKFGKPGAGDDLDG